ncbi:MAG: alpha-L-fucosidase [Bacteroidetes bacterium]|nr:alpha-L-fucosidase [Bacteroidota bacterium]
MRTKLLILLAAILLTFQGIAQKDYLHESKTEKTKRMLWWKDATFGMFIHWGLYSVPAGRYHGKVSNHDCAEWIMNDEKIPIKEYETFATQFNPEKFNAQKWVSIAKRAGVKYIVITSKHHDGFCLWDSKVSDYTVTKATPFKRDILKELSVECRKQGIRFCTYHSIMDWHQPDANGNNTNDWAKYREQYLKPQLAEIIHNYHPAVMWFDGEWIDKWTEDQGKDLYNFLRNLDPKLIVNNRVGKGRSGMQGMNKTDDAVGDFGTPEQEILGKASDLDWESCMTLNKSWGFKQDDHNWKAADALIQNIVEIVSKGGNYLLNVGPTAAGEIPVESVERLDEIGKWLKKNGSSVYGNKKGLPKENYEGYSTLSKDGTSLYLFVDSRSKAAVILKGMNNKFKSVSILGNKSHVDFYKSKNDLLVTIPQKNLDKYITVLKIQLKK